MENNIKSVNYKHRNIGTSRQWVNDPIALALGMLLGSASWLSAAVGDDNWDLRFGSPVGSSFNGSALASTIYTVVADGPNVYIGGQFSNINGVAAENVARWDGLVWHPLDGGVNGPVRHILVSGTNVFVGGTFSQAGGNPAANIARWDGLSWSAVGGGVSFSGNDPSFGVNALAMVGNDLYAGGRFDSAGGNPATNIARWDGVAWQPLISVYTYSRFSVETTLINNGVTSAVKALTTDGSTLFVGGTFLQATGTQQINPFVSALTYATNLVAWNGSAWGDVGWVARTYFGSIGGVECLARQGNNLIAGGSFSAGNGDPFNGVAVWDGLSWKALASGTSGSVRSLAVDGAKLYVGGFFGSAGDATANSLAMWDGFGWTGSAQTMDPKSGPTLINAIAVDQGGNLYAGGLFKQIDTAQAQNIAIRTAGGWGGLGDGLALNQRSGAGYALARYQGSLVVAGAFTTAGGVQAQNIASWNGANWNALGHGLVGSVSTMTVLDSNLYAGGNFYVPGKLGANNIAQWDGAEWNTVGGGIEGSVHALAVYNSNLFVGGEFKSAGGLAADGIAMWNGQFWQNVGPPHALAFGKIYALAVMGGKLYAAGLFAHNAVGNSIAVWDGANWSNLGLGLQSRVYAMAYTMATDGNRLFVGGNFETAGGFNTPNLAVWDGENWSGVGAPPSGVVFALQYAAGTLFAGGAFVDGFGVGANNIASWNGFQWSPLGRGTGFPNSGGSFVEAILADQSSMYAAGNFSLAGGNRSDGLALYHLRSAASTGAHIPVLRTSFGSGSITIQLDDDATGYVLQSCDDPGSGRSAWNPVILVTGATSISLNTTSGMQYFRLAK